MVYVGASDIHESPVKNQERVVKRINKFFANPDDMERIAYPSGIIGDKVTEALSPGPYSDEDGAQGDDLH